MQRDIILGGYDRCSWAQTSEVCAVSESRQGLELESFGLQPLIPAGVAYSSARVQPGIHLILASYIMWYNTASHICVVV